MLLLVMVLVGATYIVIDNMEKAEKEEIRRMWAEEDKRFAA